MLTTDVKPFFFEPQPLLAKGSEQAAAYAAATPFPHGVFEHFLPPEVLEQVLDEFPDPNAIDWTRYDRQFERKLTSKDENQLGPATRHLIAQLHSSTFCRFLQHLTGIQGLVPDPHLLGGGIHQMQRGGYLKVHADFNQHPELRLDRRINLLIYLNKDWQEAYGGHLELWDTKMTRCERRVLPVFNRCVVFSTTSTAFHGNPDPLQCPPERTRKSLALYYYTNGRPEEEARAAHSTLFKLRPSERLAGTAKQVLLKLTPPIVADAVHAVKVRWGSSK